MLPNHIRIYIVKWLAAAILVSPLPLHLPLILPWFVMVKGWAMVADKVIEGSEEPAMLAASHYYRVPHNPNDKAILE